MCVIIGVEIFSVSFLVPTDFVPNLILFTSQIDHSFYQTECISSITINYKWLTTLIQDLLVQQEHPLQKLLDDVPAEQGKHNFSKLELRINEDVISFTLDKLNTTLEKYCNDIYCS